MFSLWAQNPVIQDPKRERFRSDVNVNGGIVGVSAGGSWTPKKPISLCALRHLRLQEAIDQMIHQLVRSLYLLSTDSTSQCDRHVIRIAKQKEKKQPFYGVHQLSVVSS